MPQNDESGSREDQINQAIVEFLNEEQRGEAPQVDAYLKRFPEHARSLRSFFENYQRLRNIGPEPDAKKSSTIAPSESARDTSMRKSGGEIRQTAIVGSDPFILPGQFGRYRIEQLLGKGGMGAVYLAEDLDLHRKVAIKVPTASMLDDPDLASRFEREARAAALLRHPNICTVYDVGNFNGVRYLTMAFIEGAPLSKVISSSKTIPPKKAAVAIRKLAQALQHAHDLGIVHRDLKSANVMIDKRGDPILMDFGLARFINATIDIRLTQSGAILGTPAYMSPEHWSGDSAQIGPAADIYCLGVIFYELLTGRLPFRAPISQLVQQILFVPPPPPSEFVVGLPSVLEAICLKMLAKQPTDRFARMSDVAEALASYLRDPEAASTSLLQAAPMTESFEAAGRPDDRTKTFIDSIENVETQRPSINSTIARGKRRVIADVTGAALSMIVAISAVLFWIASRDESKAAKRVDSLPEIAHFVTPATTSIKPALASLDDPPGKEMRLDRTLIGAKAPGIAIAFSSNGRSVSAAFENGEVVTWDLKTRDVISRFKTPSPPCALFILPGDDQLLVASGGNARTISRYNVRTGLRTDVFQSATDNLSCAALNPALGIVAAGTESHGILVWDLIGQTLKPQSTPDRSISAIGFLPDGNAILSGDGEGDLTIIPLDGGAGQRTMTDLKGHATRITGIAPLSDNRHVLTTSVSGEMVLWNVETGQMWKDFGRHEGGVGSIQLMPGPQENRYAVSSCLDGLLQIWDLEERRVAHEVGSRARQGSATISPDGDWIATFGDMKPLADNDQKNVDSVTVDVWRVPVLAGPRGNFPGSQDPALRRPADLNPHKPPIEPKPDSKISFLEVVHEFVGHTGLVTSACMTADAHFGFTSGGWPTGDGVIRKWDLQTGKLVGSVLVRPDFVTGISISPDGNLLFSGSKEGPIRLWNGVNGGELIRFPGTARGTALTQNGLLGFTITDNGNVRIWELEPGKKPRTLSGINMGKVIRLSPNEQLIAAGGQDNRICIWNLTALQKAGKPTHTIQIVGGLVEDVQFSPDGLWLASIESSGGIRIWDVETGKQKRLMEGHGKNTPKSENSPVRNSTWGTALAFVADGEFLVSAGRDETLRLWRVDTGREVGRQLVPSGYVANIAAARVSDLLLTVGEPLTNDPARKTENPVQVHLWKLSVPPNARP